MSNEHTVLGHAETVIKSECLTEALYLSLLCLVLLLHIVYMSESLRVTDIWVEQGHVTGDAVCLSPGSQCL